MTCASMPLLRTCYREVTTAQAPPGIGPLTGDVHHEAEGFYDQAHLTWHFKRTVGLTPGRYVWDKGDV